MVNYKEISISTILSILVHIFVIIFFFSTNQEVNKVTVIDFSSFSENQFENSIIRSKSLKIPKIEKNFEIEKIEKIEKIQKIEKKNYEEEKKLITNNSNLSNQKKVDYKNQKVFEREKKDFSNYESKRSVSQKSEIIKDQELYDFLLSFSKKLNKIALNTYPTQSLKRNEQGTIISELVVDKNGQIIRYEVKTKMPKRLAEAAKRLIKKNKDFGLKPPLHVFKKKDFLVFEIKIIYKIY